MSTAPEAFNKEESWNDEEWAWDDKSLNKQSGKAADGGVCFPRSSYIW